MRVDPVRLLVPFRVKFPVLNAKVPELVSGTLKTIPAEAFRLENVAVTPL